jgi:glycosyl transferase family 25
VCIIILKRRTLQTAMTNEISAPKNANPTALTPYEKYLRAPTFVMNLKRRMDRRQHIAEEAVVCGFSDTLVWVEAIDGKNMTPMQLQANLSLRAKQDIRATKSTHEGLYSSGAVACYETHRKIWKHIIDNEISCAKVCEDDIKGDVRELKNIKKYINALPSDAQYVPLCKLMFVRGQPKKVLNSSYYMDLDGVLFLKTTAYYITYECARLLYERSLPIETQVDSYIANMSLDRNIKSYCLTHPFIGEISSATDIQTACIKCILPDETHFYVGIVVGMLILLLVLALLAKRLYNQHSKLQKSSSVTLSK